MLGLCGLYTEYTSERKLTKRARNGHPLQSGVELKGENQDIDPCDLRNGDGIRNGQGRV